MQVPPNGGTMNFGGTDPARGQPSSNPSPRKPLILHLTLGLLVGGTFSLLASRRVDINLKINGVCVCVLLYSSDFSPGLRRDDRCCTSGHAPWLGEFVGRFVVL